MASNLTDQVRSISDVTKAVAAGDLSKFVEVDVQGEMLDLKQTVRNLISIRVDLHKWIEHRAVGQSDG